MPMTPSYEIPARATAGLVRAGVAAITAAGQPAILKGYVGDQFPAASHSFLMGAIPAYQLPEFEHYEEGTSVQRATRFRLTVGRLRQVPFESLKNCGPMAWLGDLPLCAEPLPQLPSGTCDEEGELVVPTPADEPVKPVTVTDAWVQASVDRAILESSRLVAAFCEELKACRIPGGKSLKLESSEPYEEGRFIGTRIEWSARLG